MAVLKKIRSGAQKTAAGSFVIAKSFAVLAMLYSPAGAQEKFLTIETTGELPAQLRAALNEVITPSSFEAVVAEGAEKAVPLKQLCNSKYAMKACDDAIATMKSVSHNIDEKLSKLVDEKTNKPFASGIKVLSLRLPRLDAAGVKDTYVLVDSGSPAYKAQESAIKPDSGIFAVPVEEKMLKAGIDDRSIIQADNAAATPAITPTWFDNSKNFALSLLKQDTDRFGEARRQFKIDPGASPEAVERVLELAKASPTTSAEIALKPTNEFEIEGSLPIAGPAPDFTFEADSDECSAPSPGWPFDAEKVAATLAFDQKVIDRIGSNILHRSSVLIVDSGLGGKLAQTDFFKPFLQLNVSERLYADNYFKDASFAGDSKICLDIDHDQGSDTFGYAPEDPEINCQTHTPLERIAPIPKLPGDRAPAYAPEHGSFVATLAVGGPDLMRIAQGLDRYVGLSFARITRTPDSEKQSVKTEVGDLRQALKFAVDHRVDVINASLRITNPKFRNDLVEQLKGFNGIIVAAAGNHPEELTDESGNFPAALTGNIRDGHLIVVGATQPAPAERWWPNSAFSPELVDIAAPGAHLISLNENADRVCMSGTSAAAPLVSFTAGILRSIGVERASEVRQRILATAEIDNSLITKVQGGRVLDMRSAMDVFVDLIWFGNDVEPHRVLLRRPDADEKKPVLLQLCKPDTGQLDKSSGFIDPAALLFWHRLPGEKAEIWHRMNNEISGMGKNCSINDVSVTYYDLQSRSLKASPIAEINRIVPTPFRSALDETLAVSKE